MNGIPELLKDVFETYFGANYFISDWDRLRKFLNHPKFPNRGHKFKKEFSYAIINNSITPKVLEELTGIDYETQEEVNGFLINDIWKPLYGDEPIKA